MTTSTHRIVAVTDDVLDCDVCGLPLDRERVYLVENVDTGDRHHAGTTCGARLLGTTPARFRTEADRQARDRAATERHQARLDRLRPHQHAFQAILDAATADMARPQAAGFLGTGFFRQVDRVAQRHADTIVPLGPDAGFDRPGYGGHARDDAAWARYLLVQSRQALTDLHATDLEDAA